MRQGRFGVVLAWAFTLVLLSAPGRAQETRAANPEMDERAMAVLQRMAALLAQAQESRQNYASDYDHYHSGCCYGGYYGGYYHGGAYAAGVVTGAVIGSTLTAAAFSAQAPSCTTVSVSGLTYYHCGATWYQPATQGSQVTYVVVNPPK